MKVLHLWESDPLSGGGGAVVMNRLHSGLRRLGIDSHILSSDNTTGSPYVHILPRPRRIESLIRLATSRLGLNDVHCVGSFRIPRLQVYRDTDLVTIHGTHSGFLNYLALPSLTREKPTVFVLHDMWLLTGHCAQSYGCDRWKIGCGRCPYPDAYPPIRKDATHIEWKLKRRVYAHSRLFLVSPSRWLAELTRKSMAAHLPIQVIPHGVDTKTYSPIDRILARKVLGIPQDRKVLMFSSLNLSDHYKGGGLLTEVLKGLPASLKSRTLLLMLGNRGEAMSPVDGIPVLNLGYTASDHLKAIAYSAADLFVLPTRAEAFGLVLLESMACGTPCVSFRVGGVPDIVRPGVTGYLAEPESAEDMREGIVQLLQDEDLHASISRQCRDIAVNEYRLETQVERYVRLYEQLLYKGGSAPRVRGMKIAAKSDPPALKCKNRRKVGA